MKNANLWKHSWSVLVFLFSYTITFAQADTDLTDNSLLFLDGRTQVGSLNYDGANLNLEGTSNQLILSGLSGLSFRTGRGTDQMTILDNGSIGMGTLNPNVTSRLTIQGKTDLYDAFRINTGNIVNLSNHRPGLFMRALNGVPVGAIYADVANQSPYSSNLKIQAQNEMHFFTDGNTTDSKVVINQDGYLGIGTTSPTDRLSVDGDTRINGDLRITPNDISIFSPDPLPNMSVLVNLDWYDDIVEPAYWLKVIPEIPDNYSGDSELRSFLGDAQNKWNEVHTDCLFSKEIRAMTRIVTNYLTAGRTTIASEGTLITPQLTLRQEAGDYARMRFTNNNSFANGNHDFFTIQANVKPASGGDGRFHISYRDDGAISNIFTIQVEGSTKEAGINTNTPNYTWEVNGSAGKPGGGDWSNASDKRLKKDVEKFEDGLEQILKIRPVWYRYNGLYGMPTKEKYVGIIAQEMQKVAPYTITPYLATDEKTGNQKEFLSYNGTAVTYMLVNAIQEQQKMIEAKDDIVENLQKQNQVLEARLAKLETIILDKNSIQNNITSTLTSAKLEQNNPNPFKGKTSIQYYLPEGTNTATLRITDANGRVIKEIPIASTGEGQIELETSTLSVGNYFYSLLLDGQIFETKQMVLQR